MGNAYTAFPEDSGGMVVNPTAGVMAKKSELYVSNVSMSVADMDLVNYLGFISKSSNGVFAWGMYFQNSSPGAIQAYDNSGVRIGTIGETNTAFGFNLSVKIARMVAIGFTGKLITELIDYKYSSWFGTNNMTVVGAAAAADLGFNFITPSERFMIGYAITNLGGKMKKTASGTGFSSVDAGAEPLPTSSKFGMGFKFLKNKNWIVGFDYDMGMLSLKKLTPQMNIGTEFSPFKWIAFRFGLTGLGNYATGATTGIGLKFGGLEIDIASAGKGEMGNTSHFSLKYAFAGPSQQPAQAEPQQPVEPAEPGQPPTPADQIKQAQEAVAPVEQQKFVPLPPKKMEDRMNIAIAEFSGRNVSSMEAAIVSDFLRGELVKTEQFNVLDRQNMETLLNEQKFSNVSGCTTEECAVQMGKLLNVKKIITGSLSKLLEKYYITINIIDVESGKIEAADKDSATNADEISTACERIGLRVGAKYK
jgi:TolB-like protein